MILMLKLRLFSPKTKLILGRVFLGFLTTCILYANVATLVNSPIGGIFLATPMKSFQPPPYNRYDFMYMILLPLPPFAGDLFSIFFIFAGYIPFNRNIVINGELDNKHYTNQYEKWVGLDVGKYFPYIHEQQFIRVLAFREKIYLGDEGQAETVKRVAQRVRERHNKEYPLYAIKRVAIGSVKWPLSDRDYFEFRSPKTERYDYVYVDK